MAVDERQVWRPLLMAVDERQVWRPLLLLALLALPAGAVAVHVKTARPVAVMNC
jgi:hypothetical protein